MVSLFLIGANIGFLIMWGILLYEDNQKEKEFREQLWDEMQSSR